MVLTDQQTELKAACACLGQTAHASKSVLQCSDMDTTYFAYFTNDILAK